MNPLAEQAADLLDDVAEDSTPLHGGDLSEIVRVRLASGRAVVAKSGGTARAEAAMLRAIADSGAPAPAVLALSDMLLVMSDLGRETGLSQAWHPLGEAVARLHAKTGTQYGWHEDHAFGSVGIPNAPLDDWPTFWAERRLLPSVPALSPGLARELEQLAGRLSERLPRAPRPALLHGDLWTGNVMAAEGAVTGLIDPACYYGDAEVDLAMLCLFGRPAPEFWDGYGPVEPGLEERRPIYTLWPALVHLRLFGGGYAGLVERLIREAQ